MATAVKKTAKGAAGGSKKTVRQRAAEIREEMKEAYDLGYRHGYAAGERLPDTPGVKAPAETLYRYGIKANRKVRKIEKNQD